MAAASRIKGHRDDVRRGSLSLLDQPPIFPFKLSYGPRLIRSHLRVSRMGPVAIGLLAFGLALAGILLGSVLQRTLPTSQLSPESKEVVKLSLGIVATLSALVLGLLV